MRELSVPTAEPKPDTAAPKLLLREQRLEGIGVDQGGTEDQAERQEKKTYKAPTMAPSSPLLPSSIGSGGWAEP